MEYLKLDKSKFYRIKRGQTAKEAESVLSQPVDGCFDGKIIPVGVCEKYSVKPFESYASIAAAHGLSENVLSDFNFGRALYPTRVIFIPAGGASSAPQNKGL